MTLISENNLMISISGIHLLRYKVYRKKLPPDTKLEMSNFSWRVNLIDRYSIFQSIYMIDVKTQTKFNLSAKPTRNNEERQQNNNINTN